MEPVGGSRSLNVAVGSRVRLRCKVAKVEDYPPTGVKTTWQSTIEIEGVEKPACVAEFISLTFE